MKKYKITSKVRFTIFATVLVLMVITVTTTLMGFNTANSSSMDQYKHVEIQYGETLWEIASENAPDNVDVREVVYDICEANDLTAGEIVPGQEIIVPIYN